MESLNEEENWTLQNDGSEPLGQYRNGLGSGLNDDTENEQDGLKRVEQF